LAHNSDEEDTLEDGPYVTSVEERQVTSSSKLTRAPRLASKPMPSAALELPLD